MRNYTLNSAFIILALARGGRTHRCGRCERPMLVRYESGLCVVCYNATDANETGDDAAAIH